MTVKPIQRSSVTPTARHYIHYSVLEGSWKGFESDLKI